MGKKNNTKKRQSNLDGNWCFFSVLGKMGLAKLPILQKLG